MPRDLSIDQLTLYLAELGESPLKILGYFAVNKHEVYFHFTVWFRSLSATQVRYFISRLYSKSFIYENS